MRKRRRNGKQWEGYVRVSSVGKRQVLISPEIQRDAIERKAASMGVEISRWTEDLDTSGHGIERRADFRAIVERVAAGESGGIVVHRLDRFSRNAHDAITVCRQIDYAIACSDMDIDVSTPIGRQMFREVLSLGEMQWDVLARGFVNAKARAVREGKGIARTPIGYLKNGDQRLVPDPTVAPLIREVFERRAAGVGPSELGRFLESHGVRTSQGGNGFSKQAVASLLKSRVYLGEIRWTERAPDERDGSGKVIRRGAVIEVHVNREAHEPILVRKDGSADEELWERAQQPNWRRLQPARSRARDYLLTGVVRCGSCGYSMQSTTNGRGIRVYRCTRNHAGGQCPAPVTVRAEPVEGAAAEALSSVVEALRDRAGNRGSDALDVDALAAEVERAADRLAQIQQPAAQDALGDQYLQMFKRRREEYEQIVMALDAAREAQAEHDVIYTPGPGDVGDDVPVAQRREAMARYLDAVAVRRIDGNVCLDFYPRGTLPQGMDLSRRGFKRKPKLRPFPEPAPPEPGFRHFV
jgi:DNA invertase Pin-like site-specific DNA recombinase